jgi:hypothetical protein
MKNDKILILKKLLLLFIVVFVLDFAIGAFLKKSYYAQKSGADYRTTEVVDVVKPDILVLGSSRASHHYDISIIEDSLKLSAYNGGRDGSFMFFYYAMLEASLKRYHPKMVIVDIIPDEFEETASSYDRLSVLLPYYKSHPELREVCELRGKFEKIKLLSKIYPYNSKLFSALTTVLHLKQKDEDDAKLKGYIPMSNVLTGAKPFEKLSGKTDSIKVKYFKKFISDCQTAGVKLMVIVSPIYVQYQVNNPNITIAKRMCDSAHVPFYDYSTSKDFDNVGQYADAHHLNSQGAEQFTKMNIANIRKALKGE